jgi:hypothetical protein
MRAIAPLSALLVACSTTGGAASIERDEDAGNASAEAAAPQPDAGTTFVDGGAPRNAVRVSQNRLVDEQGRPIRLLGVNHSGGEYMCIQGRGIFDVPAGFDYPTGLVNGIAAWRANTVRIGLNEDCWLGINSVDERYGGGNYQRAVRDLVERFRARGIYVILEVHWSAPGVNRAERQQPMLDADHGADFWRSVAATFASDLGVVFDVFNEPYLTNDAVANGNAWACWRDGCTVTKSNLIAGPWQSIGMQALVDTVRSTGAKNVVMVGGLAYSNDLSGWLAHKPRDPEAQLAASMHLYNFNACASATCWDAQVAPVAAEVPLVTGEIGENDCAHGFIDTYMAWADARAISYLGWTWNPWDCRQGPALVTDLGGTPTPFGQGLRDHLLAL